MICKIEEHPSFEESTQNYTGSIPSSVFFTFMNHSKYINVLSIVANIIWVVSLMVKWQTPNLQDACSSRALPVFSKSKIFAPCSITFQGV